MLKYCNGCKRDLEIDNFYSYKKSICKECVNKKVKCEYCDREFNSTNLSKHIKQRHSTNNSTNNITNNSTNNITNNSTNISTNNSTNNDIIDDPLYPTIGDSQYLNNYLKLNKDKIYDIKTRNQINRILTKNRILHDKIKNKNITIGEQKQFENNIYKLRDLDYVDERVCKILLKYKYLD